MLLEALLYIELYANNRNISLNAHRSTVAVPSSKNIYNIMYVKHDILVYT